MQTRKLALAAFAALVLLASTSGTALAAAGQTWYLGGQNVLVANRGSVPPAVPDDEFPSNRIEIANGQSAVWESNEPATVDVAFPADLWSWSLRLATGRFSGAYHVELGVSDCQGNFSPKAWSPVMSGPNNAAPGQYVATGDIIGPDFVVLKNQCLAFRVFNDDDAEKKALHVVYSDNDSWFTSGPSDPGYPTPELGTLLLAGAGVGIVALAARRRQ